MFIKNVKPTFNNNARKTFSNQNPTIHNDTTRNSNDILTNKKSLNNYEQIRELVSKNNIVKPDQDTDIVATKLKSRKKISNNK
jgi:hypothetical protein